MDPQAAQQYQPSTDTAYQTGNTDPYSTQINTTTQPTSSDVLYGTTSSISPNQQTNGGSKLFTGLIFIVLFAVGVVASMAFRTYLSKPNDETEVVPTEIPEPTEVKEEDTVVFADTPTIEASPSVRSKPTNTPKPAKTMYGFRDARTGVDIPGASFKLPPNTKALECDKPNCISQGTDLPGKTRLTIALRGEGQQLRDFRGGAISDAAGKEFVMQKTEYMGREAVEYEADFTGSTISNIRFGKMRGIMIAFDEDNSVEINHFCPAATQCDFNSDDMLYDDLLDSLILPEYVMPVTSTQTPTISPTTQMKEFSSNELCTNADNTKSLSYDAAYAIAQTDCQPQGNLKTTRMCNTNTGTWWIDMESTKEGCSPACVVSVTTRIGEINWRCTGLVQ